MIEGYLGYATPETIIFRGRELDRTLCCTANAHDSRLMSLLAMLRLFATDEVTEVRMTGGQQDVLTDDEGYFTLVTPRNVSP